MAVLSDRGYGIFDKVLTSSVTPNGYNILISTTVPEYSFVLRQRDNVFDAEHWGMVADGAADFTSGTDNSGVWQAIIDSTENNGAVINLPNGRINILTPIDYGVSGIDRISTRGGNGTDGTIVFTTASITQLVRLPTSTGNTNNVAGGEFIAIDFNAQENADYCIKGYGNHMLFRDCRFRKAVIAGTDVSFGYDNMWDHCYWRDNLQDGEIMDQGQNNQNTHIGCKYFDNGRFGVFAKSSLALSYTNCLFEQNSGAAIFAFGLDGIHLDNCYFDRNGMASLGGGHTFSTPSQTVYADIILTGSSSTTTMSVGTPCKGVTITSPFVSGSAADAHTHVYAISSEGLTVNNATLNDGDIGDLVTTYGSTTTSSQYSRNKGLRIGRENNFDNKLVVQNSTTGFAGQEDMIIEDIDVINIIDTDLTNWLAVVGGGGTFTNSTEQHSLGPKVSVHELDFASTSTSSQFGFNVDVTDYPALTGEPMLACIDVKADSSNTPTITFQADGCTRTSSSTDWTRLYVIFNMPASGTIRFSVKKGSGTGKAYVSIPILCRLGNDNRKLIGTI